MHPQDTTPPEEWRRITDSEIKQDERHETHYEVSNLGRVRSIRYCIRRPYITETGYAHVTIYRNGKRQAPRLSRLVATAFLGPPPDRYEANHRNGVKADNRSINLEWVSSSQNKRHAFVMGLTGGPRPSIQGTRNAHAKLTDDDVREIRALAGTVPAWVLGRRYGVSRGAIWHILKRRSWAHVS